jgi:hypothetical protein
MALGATRRARKDIVSCCVVDVEMEEVTFIEDWRALACSYRLRIGPRRLS